MKIPTTSSEGTKWLKQIETQLLFSTSEILRHPAPPPTHTGLFWPFPATVRVWLFFSSPVTLHQYSGTGSAQVQLACGHYERDVGHCHWTQTRGGSVLSWLSPLQYTAGNPGGKCLVQAGAPLCFFENQIKYRNKNKKRDYGERENKNWELLVEFFTASLLKTAQRTSMLLLGLFVCLFVFKGSTMELPQRWVLENKSFNLKFALKLSN